ncbi:MAG: sugar isomerase [Planctomycetaceae bacterium]|nr:sugar isomerase [Planctomycetaceae bacterium]
MNPMEAKYNSFAIVREMLETPEIIGRFDFKRTASIAQHIKQAGKLCIAGEGSSRIFPAKNFVDCARRSSSSLNVFTEGSRQCMDYDLSAWAVMTSSNSGQTAETIDFLANLQKQGHQQRFAVTANPKGKIIEFANESVVLTCGKEDAVAATKSVVEQALVYQSVLCNLEECDCPKDAKLAEEFAYQVLDAEYGSSVIDALAQAGTIYWAGRNNGVAEELTLKTCEIARQKSTFLEGTILLHGVEETMLSKDVIVLIDPFEAEWPRIQQRYVEALNMRVIAVAPQQTPFETVVIPALPCYDPYLQLLAGWNLLVQVGIAHNLNIDKPKRARKVGNEYTGT